MLFFFSLILFGGIAGVAYWKKIDRADASPVQTAISIQSSAVDTPITLPPESKEIPQAGSSQPIVDQGLPDIDRINEFFNTGEPKLPFVKTISYKSQVNWLPGRAAWVTDYAAHFKTSRHFIARSLNGKADYYRQNVRNGDNFNVLDPDLDIRFHLVVDISRAKMWFYAFEATSQERILIKSYPVGIGRQDSNKPSGFLTPIGTYQLGDRVAVYHANSTGVYNNEKTSMRKVFGTRWIPFEKGITNCTAQAKGLGIHGAPWDVDDGSGVLKENRESVGNYTSDGCIRLLMEDVEELFSIIISRPTTIEIVKDFKDAKLPGTEKS